MVEGHNRANSSGEDKSAPPSDEDFIAAKIAHGDHHHEDI